MVEGARAGAELPATEPGSSGGSERLTAAFVLLLMLPVVVGLAVAVGVVLGSPVFVRERTAGRPSTVTPLVRFRTRVSPRRFGGPDGRRVAARAPRGVRLGERFGGALQRSGLDHLPALWDVARGRGSLSAAPSMSHDAARPSSVDMRGQFSGLDSAAGRPGGPPRS